MSKFALGFILACYVLPITLRGGLFVFEEHIPPEEGYEIESANMASTGILPDAAALPAARVTVFSTPLAGEKGKFLTHSWIVLKRENDTFWSRCEVLGFASRDYRGERNPAWLGNKPALNRYAPDGRWFGRQPVVLADLEGPAAAAIIPRIEVAIANYEATLGQYRTWPGPNSNTFVAYVLRAAPELRATLPPLAVGKDFKSGIFVGLSDSRTGIELNISGILGLKVGWIEGIEFNLLGSIAGLELRQPALKVPLFGRIDFLHRNDEKNAARECEVRSFLILIGSRCL